MKQANKLFYVVAGETSGDIHGARLLASIKKQLPSADFKGVGGPLMEKEGLMPCLPFSQFQVMGFSDVIKALPLLTYNFFSLRALILRDQPDAVIFIDYPGFNLRLARSLKRKHFSGKLIQYISPSVWAWKKDRIRVMEESLDLLLMIYPFEKKFFNNSSLKTTFVGHPLVSLIPSTDSKEERKPLLALFPGSRPAEVARNLPIQREACRHFLERHPEFEVAISLSSSISQNEVEKLLLDAPFSYAFIKENDRFDLMKRAQVALAKSGTVSLELALLGCPSVIMYKLSALNYFLARHIFRINLPYFSLPNILLQQPLCKEYFHKEIDPLRLSDMLEEKLKTQKEAEDSSREIKNLLTSKNAAEESAKEILALW